MARTFGPDEAAQFAAVVTEVNRLTAEIEETDTQHGTLRPEGHSLGKLYERLGIHLVAMYNEGVTPSKAIKMIRQVAEDASEIESAALITFLRDEAEALGECNVIVLCPGPDETC
jgi:hypothetical protein